MPFSMHLIKFNKTCRSLRDFCVALYMEHREHERPQKQKEPKRNPPNKGTQMLTLPGLRWTEAVLWGNFSGKEQRWASPFTLWPQGPPATRRPKAERDLLLGSHFNIRSGSVRGKILWLEVYAEYWTSGGKRIYLLKPVYDSKRHIVTQSLWNHTFIK